MLLENKRIFLVEDRLENRLIIRRLLEEAGAEVAHDRWGTAVIHKVINFLPVHLVILDLMFPHGVTGYDVFDQIRSVSELREIPIVAVSAADTSEAIPKAKQKGFAGFISKPVDFDNFSQQIADIINGEEIWQHR